MAEILPEINKPELKQKAYATLSNCLAAEKKSDQIAAASSLLKFTEGEIIRQSDLLPDDKSEFQRLRSAIVINIIPQSDVK